PKWPDERAGLSRVFVLLRDRLGRPDRFEATNITSPKFLNVRVESATPDEWQRSGCAFKTYMFKTNFVDGGIYRPAEVVTDVCHMPAGAHSWLRKVDVRFVGQDPKVAKTMQEIVEAVQVARKVKDAGKR